MKEMREIETTIRSWSLRQPSVSVSKRIFETAEAAQTSSEQDHVAPFAFRWLVPATAGFLLLCLVANPRGNQGLSDSSTQGPMVAMIISNQSAIPYLPGSFKADQNNVPADTFEWTNVSGYTSSNGSLSGPRGSR
jgi:hypothetical protein